MADVPIQRKITKKEREFIEKYKNENKIPNDSQFLKLAIEDLIGVNIADINKPENRTLPLEYRTVYYFYDYLKRAYKSSPKDQKTIEELFKNWADGFWRIHTEKQNKKLDKANEMWDYFKTKRKVGRHPKPKRNRGREKEKGYDDQKVTKI
jgi:hypothetical protein